MREDPSDPDASTSSADEGDAPDGSADDWELPADAGRSGPRTEGGSNGPANDGTSSRVANRTGSDGPEPRDGPLAAMRYVLGAEEGAVVFVREILTSVFAVLAIGLLLFAVSGVWPPMVAVESGSMEPHLQKGDLVFVMDEHRFAPAYAIGDTGVVPASVGAEHDYRSLGGYGDVIIYHPNGNAARKPVIHRARFWVEDGENWLSKADPSYVSGDDCASVPNCPAPHAGFITKGDNPRTNDYYDQTRGISRPVRPAWIEGTAELRIPWLGWVRLTFSEMRTGDRLPVPAVAG